MTNINSLGFISVAAAVILESNRTKWKTPHKGWIAQWYSACLECTGQLVPSPAPQKREKSKQLRWKGKYNS